MRVFLVLFAMCFCYAGSRAQTFTGTGGTIPGTSTSQTCFSTTVSGVGTINGAYGLASVCINITHPYDDELEIVLTAPDGTVVPLTIQNGGSGDNYTNTCFSATATNPIKFGTAPFTGSFLPEGHLGAVNNGQNANGVWRLCIQDRRTAANNGTLNNWSLTFNNSPAPVPPALPSCANTLPSTSSCSTATLVCDFNGQCGSTSGSTVQDWTGSGLGSCFGLQNNSFIRFVASASTASFSVWVPTTTQASYNQGGIQMLFFSGTCNSGAVTSYGCYPHILPYSGTGQPLITVVSASGLTPGNTYYLMIDGFNNDNCTFTIAANSGVNILNINPAAPAICTGQSVNLTASGGNGTYSWSPATNLSSTSGTTVAANPPSTITYTVTSTTPSGCPITKDVTVTVNPLPAAPTATVTAQPTCIVTSGTITITAPTGAGIQYSIGGAYQSSPVFAGLAPGSYNVTVQNAAGCISTVTVLTVNNLPPTPPAPTVTVTAQPTCSSPTGTITVTAPTGAGITYSIGGPFQASPVFSGLAQNVYNVTVQNAAGCISPGTSVTINAAPTAPAAPTATVTAQPTCTVATGTITITAPTGAGLQYSVGGAYQSSPTFTGLTPGSYNVTVQNAAGCTSPVTTLTVNAAPTAPAAPTATVTAQPSCTVATGTITITAPTGAGLQYSVGGAYQSSTTFTGLTPGSYNVTVQNAAGCTSPVTTLTVNTAPTAPAAPTPTVTAQPNCTTPTGTITITAPTGAGLQYSVGGAYQSSTTFAGLTPGSYNITVQNAAGCISPVTTLTVNAVPVPPAAPAASVTTAPTCTVPTGTITISAPIGAGYEYSVNGTNYQSSPVFAGLNPNAYSVTVRDIASGCVSAAVIVVVPAAPSAQQGPLNITTVQPGCASPTGTIILTPPPGTNLEFSINGTTYQSSTTFNNVAPGNYSVTVRNTVTGCISIATAIVVDAAPTLPTGPVGSVTIQPDCTNPTGQITITSPTGANYEYAIDGGTFQSSPVFNNLGSGTHTVIVRNTISGCVSPASSFTVNNGPAGPQAPVLVTTQPNCEQFDATITVTSPLGAQYQYSLNGGSFTANPVFSVLVQGTYDVRVREVSTGCISAGTTTQVTFGSSNPAKPVITQVQPSCPLLTGTITVNSPTGANLEYSINGTTYQSSPVFTNVPGGSYNVTVRFTGTSCVSSPTAVTIFGLTPEQCQQPGVGDIYFPTAFTPNGDGRNDGFGPGPRSNLGAVTRYTLQVFNRFGELVYKTNDPYAQWDGRFKGKMLGNFSYTWVAEFSYNGQPVQMRKGMVTIIR
ncbi:MAG: gliding motility-associated C-terminal domain-containing protein [Ferruginibacter sp.]